MKQILKQIVVLGILLMFTGCTLPIAKYERLKHTSTERFYDSNNLFFLQKFKANDVYFVLEPKKVGYPEYSIWLGAYSEIPRQSIKINSAQILSEKITLDSVFDPTVLNLLFKEKRSLHNDSLKLFKLGNEDSQALQDSKDIKLELYYQVEGQDEEVMIFEIESYYYYDIAWPT